MKNINKKKKIMQIIMIPIIMISIKKNKKVKKQKEKNDKLIYSIKDKTIQNTGSKFEKN